MDTDPHITGGEIAGMSIEDCKIEGCSLKRCKLDGCETVYQDTATTVAKLEANAETIAAQTRTLVAQEKEITELKAWAGSYATENAQLFGRIDELSTLQNDYTRMTKQRIEVNKTLEADVAELKRQSKVDCELIDGLKKDVEIWRDMSKVDAELLAHERTEAESDSDRLLDEYRTTARICRCQRDKFKSRVNELEGRFSKELECPHCVKGQAICPRCHGTDREDARADDFGHRLTCQYPGCVKGRVPCSVCGKGTETT